MITNMYNFIENVFIAFKLSYTFRIDN